MARGLLPPQGRPIVKGFDGTGLPRPSGNPAHGGAMAEPEYKRHSCCLACDGSSHSGPAEVTCHNTAGFLRRAAQSPAVNPQNPQRRAHGPRGGHRPKHRWASTPEPTSHSDAHRSTAYLDQHTTSLAARKGPLAHVDLSSCARLSYLILRPVILLGRRATWSRACHAKGSPRIVVGSEEKNP